ncbi:hypothetical protein ABEB36_010461 [Hypothenemus hampei]|uniref:DUF4817 domain-containing protein n=1 Tax=Hypothenemus hampei TaxID=57062 RepID=A0ABD1EKD0_HYPHA
MVYTVQQKIEIIFIYGECVRWTRRTAAIFNESIPNTNLNHKYVLELIAKFTEIGSITNKKTVRMHVLSEVAQIEVLGSFVAQPTTSLRVVAREVGTFHETVTKALKSNKFHPYKM